MCLHPAFSYHVPGTKYILMRVPNYVLVLMLVSLLSMSCRARACVCVLSSVNRLECKGVTYDMDLLLGESGRERDDFFVSDSWLMVSSGA